MGVNHLWDILYPVKQRLPLSSLQGKTLAVDLSVWIMESQGVKALVCRVRKPYLRNLFFRVMHLLELDVKLVFVIEGKAPELKRSVINKRYQTIGNIPLERQEELSNTALSRPYFQIWLKECCQLLQLMGIPCIESAGEAEAMCAYLNELGLVDGCITNDGDVFLYGARTVYKDLTIRHPDAHVDCYEMDDIEDELNLSRNNLISLALLLGCDYLPKGVPGIGKEVAMKFVTSLPGEDLLQRFNEWKKGLIDGTVNTDKSETPSEGESQTSSEHSSQETKAVQKLNKLSQETKAEKAISKVKERSLQVSDFPNQEVINEYLTNINEAPTEKFTWSRPRQRELQDFLQDMLGWPEDQSIKKIFSLLLSWDIKDIIKNKMQKTQIQPHSIIKACIRNGCDCFEVCWFSNIQEENSELQTTIIKQSLFEAAFPDMTKAFLDAQPVKTKRQKVKYVSKCKSNSSLIKSVIPQKFPEDKLFEPKLSYHNIHPDQNQKVNFYIHTDSHTKNRDFNRNYSKQLQILVDSFDSSLNLEDDPPTLNVQPPNYLHSLKSLQNTKDALEPKDNRFTRELQKCNSTELRIQSNLTSENRLTSTMNDINSQSLTLSKFITSLSSSQKESFYISSDDSLENAMMDVSFSDNKENQRGFYQIAECLQKIKKDCDANEKNALQNIENCLSEKKIQSNETNDLIVGMYIPLAERLKKRFRKRNNFSDMKVETIIID